MTPILSLFLRERSKSLPSNENIKYFFSACRNLSYRTFLGKIDYIEPYRTKITLYRTNRTYCLFVLAMIFLGFGPKELWNTNCVRFKKRKSFVINRYEKTIYERIIEIISRIA